MSGRFVVMGVSGCGKTTLGQAFAAAAGLEFIDGDALHSPESVAKMARGEPLADADRWPWLDRVAAVLRPGSVVVGCSALKRRYRDRLRAGAGAPVTFLHLAGDREVIAARMAVRTGHFMPLALLDSQYAALEPPEPDELSVTVDIDQSPEEIVAALLAATGQG